MGLLVIVGALNWGLIAAFQMDVVAMVFGPMTMMTRIVYGLVGVAGVMKLVSCFKPCPCCKK